MHAVDAVAAGGPPGSLYRLDLEETRGEGRASLHELGLRSVCRLMPAERRPRVTVWGIEPGLIGFGLDLSPSVRQSVPDLVRRLLAAVGAGGDGVGNARRL